MNLVPRAILPALLLSVVASVQLVPVARGQGAPAEQYVTFWRGELRVFAVRPDTRITILDLTTGQPLDPASWTGAIGTNPFVLASAGDSFEADSGFVEQRVRVVAGDALGAGEPKPIVVWTGDLQASIRHPAGPPPNSPPPNAWASYLSDVVRPDDGLGSEIGTSFLGFSSRDMVVVVRKEGTVPVSVSVEDLSTNTDADVDDTFVLDRTSPWLMHEDAEVEAYRYAEFEDDTIRLTVQGGEASVLTGLFGDGLTDWSASPSSFVATDNGRELGTLFWTYASRWLTVIPVFNNTTVSIRDLSDGDDSFVVNLPAGGRFSPALDLYTADVLGEANQPAVPRTDVPVVTLQQPPNGPIDDDLLRIQSDRPILVYVGALSSNVREFADVAYSVPVGPTQRFVHAYAQNGGANDLQLFSFDQDNPINIRSLTTTQGFQASAFYDFNLPLSTPWEGGNALTGDWFWSSGVWDGNLLRISSQEPVQVMNGDYDGPNFGAFLPWVPIGLSEAPIADAGPDLVVCPGTTVLLDGSGSFDADTLAGGNPVRWEWDLDVATDSDGNGAPDDDVDATGATVSASFPPGRTVVQLTYVDDDGETAVDRVTVDVEDQDPPALACSRAFRAVATDFAGGPAAPSATATDACDPNPSVTNDRTAGGEDASDFYPCGVTGVTWTATDASGNVAGCKSAVVVQPELGFPSVGDVLRVRKDAAGRPVLDWSRASGLEPDTRYLVLRSEESASTRDALPLTGELTARLWIDLTAGGASLLFYDVRHVRCDGGFGG